MKCFVSTPGLLELAGDAWGDKCSFNISFSKAAKVDMRTAGVDAILTSSISVLLEKGRSQCVMLMMWRKK